MFLNKPFFLLRLTIFHLTSPFWDLWSTLTPFRSQKGRRLWPELVLSALSRWRFTFVFLKMVFFCETKVVSKFKLVFFCETKVVSSHFGGIFFLSRVSKDWNSCFLAKIHHMLGFKINITFVIWGFWIFYFLGRLRLFVLSVLQKGGNFFNISSEKGKN